MAMQRYRLFFRRKGSNAPWTFHGSFRVWNEANSVKKTLTYPSSGYEWTIHDGPPSDTWFRGKR